MVWTPTVVICNPVATVLGNTDLAVDLYLTVLAGVIWEHIPACRFLLWIFYCGKTVYKTVIRAQISLQHTSPGQNLMRSCVQKRNMVTWYLCSDWQAVGHQRAGQPLLIGWAPGKGPANAKGTLAPTEAPRWSKLWEEKGKREREKVKCHHVYLPQYHCL